MAAHLVLARHAESELGARGLVNGDPRIDCPLTERGRHQARALGERLKGIPIEACVTSEFPRTKETAEIALEGRDTPIDELAELNDPRLGIFESRPLGEYEQWLVSNDWSAAPVGGGESQLDVVRRYLKGFGALAQRPETTVIAISHALPVSIALTLLDPGGPLIRARYEIVADHCVPYDIEGERLMLAVKRASDELSSISAR